MADLMSSCGVGGIRIEQVANGFIVHADGEQWVYVSLKAALKAIQESFEAEG